VFSNRNIPSHDGDAPRLTAAEKPMTTTAMPRARWKRAALLIALGLVSACVVIELSVRIATHSLLTWGSKENEDYFVTDPLIGRLPKDGVSMRHPKGFTITIGEHGTRSNGDRGAVPPQPVTLVVGDSFAFGDGVDDRDSWPAVLERLTGQRVVNGAVPGFGLDQAVLRAEQLAPVYDPSVIIVGFIPHDVLRCEMSYWSGQAKPYFELDDSGRLVLHTAPAPPQRTFGALKRLLSKSVTMELLFAPFLHWQGPMQEIVHRRGVEVACRLMDRLAALGRARHARIVVVAQPQQPDETADDRRLKDAVLDCARAAQLSALDLFPHIDGLPSAQRTALFPRHMSAEGNRIVAAQIAEFLGGVSVR
jgi:hypothetical protein